MAKYVCPRKSIAPVQTFREGMTAREQDNRVIRPITSYQRGQPRLHPGPDIVQPRVFRNAH
ncbi:hypothetical protein DPMN_026615 [Dreissena polymorpha]|uniref:Uncharacterized protein n=1 Tax=Dreissena polymorpha TaxID=45954 RepID=A0A9D4REH5_DREPO|nr:hypothetical protein DPMN_026615 [Dreissena polymorpha]